MKTIHRGMEAVAKRFGVTVGEIFESVHRENNDGPDYWVYLRSGWICKDMDCGTIHEYTVKDVLEMFKSIDQDFDGQPVLN